MVIIAAMAQNGSGFTPGHITDVLTDKKGEFSCDIDWKEYYQSREGDPMQKEADIRQEKTGYIYNSQLLVIQYVSDLKALNQLGWPLPKGVTPELLNEIEAEARANLDGIENGLTAESAGNP